MIDPAQVKWDAPATADLGQLEQQYGLPPGLLAAIQGAEGSGPTSVSPKGAVGTFQFMPATAKAYGLTDPTDPQASAVAAAKYMADSMRRYKTSDPRVLMAEYNGGPRQALAVLSGQQPPAKETQNYIANAPSGIDPAKVQWDQAAKSDDVPMMQGLGADLAMGGRQVIDAGAQLLTRGLDAAATKIAPDSQIAQWMHGQRQNVEDINQNALNDYTARFSPDQRPISGALARGLGQAAVVGPMVAVGGPATTLLKSAVQGMAGGAAAGGLTPVYGDGDFAQQKLGQIESGAALGAAMGGAGNAIGRVLAPNSRAAVQSLTDEGVSPTVGQTLGGFWKTLEDKLTSVPLVGDAIKAGQSRGLDQFNNAIYNRILAPIGEKYDGPVGQQALGAIRDKLSGAYDATLAKMGPTPLTETFNSGVDNIRSMLAARPDALKAFDNAVNAEVWSRFTPANTLPPTALKQADSSLGTVIRDYFNRGTADQLTAARALSEVQRGLRQMAAEANPEQAPVLRAIDNGYSQLVQLQNAAKSVKVARNEGVVTPADYLRGIKSGDTSARDNVFSSGGALNQDFAQSADKVLSSKYPDSGSVGRGLAAAALGGAFAPKALALGAAGAIPYLPYAQGALSAILSRRPELLGLLGGGVKSAAPYLGAAAPAGLLSYQ